MYNQSGERCSVETAERISKLILQRNACRRAFRVVRDEYRLARRNEREWMRMHMGEYLRRREELACMALAHGFRVMCLLDRLDVARTFRAAEYTGRRS